MNKPLVSITIPTYNSETFLGLCLQSITKQTYKNIEVNIVDGDSEDKTVAIAKRSGVGNIKICKDSLLQARYEGTKITQGEYVLLLDSDQILEPSTVERAVGMMDKHDMLVLEEDVYKKEKFIEKLFHYDRKLVHIVKDFNPHTSVMLPRFYKRSLLMNVLSSVPEDIMKNVGGLDHAIIYLEAWRLSQRVELLANAVRHIEPHSLSAMWRKFYRWGGTNTYAHCGKYKELLEGQERFRKGLFRRGLLKESLASVLLLLMKGVPYKIGYLVGKMKH